MIKYLENIATGSINFAIAFFITCYFGEKNLLLGLLGFVNLLLFNTFLYYIIHELEKEEARGNSNNNKQ